MKSAPFSYHAPQTLDEAIALLAEYGEDAKVIAGGQSLVPMMALRLARFDHLVDLGRISTLRGVRREDGVVRIGAMTSHRAIETDACVAADLPLLSRAAPYIGHLPIRSRGTIGGSCAHADPAAEWPAVAVALDADLVAAGPSGQRTVASSEFFLSTFTSALEPDEVLAELRFPVWPGRPGFAVAEIARRHGDFAVAGACVGAEVADGRVARLAVGLLGLGGVPRRAAAAEQAACGQPVDSIDLEDLARFAVSDCEPPGDIHASAGYRRQVGAVAVARALRTAFKEAQRG